MDEARTFLTWIVLLAAAALTVLGGLAIALAEHRYGMVRTLSTRVVISALTYALLFRVAAWALDPQRGRSPVLGGGSVVLGSNGHIFLIAGAIAAVVAVWGGLVAYRRRAARPGERRAGRAPPRQRILRGALRQRVRASLPGRKVAGHVPQRRPLPGQAAGLFLAPGRT